VQRSEFVLYAQASLRDQTVGGLPGDVSDHQCLVLRVTLIALLAGNWKRVADDGLNDQRVRTGGDVRRCGTSVSLRPVCDARHIVLSQGRHIGAREISANQKEEHESSHPRGGR
jgi:hypothetical protein